MFYNGFELLFFDYTIKLAAYSKEHNMSFIIGLTEVQYIMYNKMYNGYKDILIYTMKN